MLLPVKLLAFLVPFYLGVVAQDETDSSDSSVDAQSRPGSGSLCCIALQALLPRKVFSRDTAEYTTRHNTYYSLQQQELSPDCTVRPTSASDVSNIVKIARAGQCSFAVASGGHMCWKGSSNMDGGFVIDLRGMNQIDISTKDQTVKLGPGSQWTEVYNAMAPYGVSATGARINAVGVGGFLLGGGIAFASVDKGFGADNVFNYEVVLSDGRIVNANEGTNSDLFWALKLAGSNFGIVTRFDLRTYSSPKIWGGVTVYPTTKATETDLLKAFADYTHDTSNKKAFKSVAWNYANGVELSLAIQTNLDPTPSKNLSSAEPLAHNELIASTHDVVDQIIAAALESTARTRWFTFTTKVSSDFFVALHEKANEIFAPLRSRPGVTTTVGFQSFQKSYIARAVNNPAYNTLKQYGDDLVCTLILVTWTNPADEAIMKKATESLGTWGEAEARKRGIFSDFIYLNYANEDQPVYQRLVSKDLKKLQTIQAKYDSSGTYQRLWKGGFKLPR